MRLLIIILALLLSSTFSIAQEIGYSKNDIQYLMRDYVLVDCKNQFLVYKCSNNEYCVSVLYIFDQNNIVYGVGYMYSLNDKDIVISSLNKSYKKIIDTNNWLDVPNQYLIETAIDDTGKMLLVTYSSLKPRGLKKT